MKIDATITNIARILDKFGVEVKQENWQGTSSPDNTIEVRDAFLTMEVPSSSQELAMLTGADLPWAEEHFQERISGEVMNPGFSYRRWPWYRADHDDEAFRFNGLFSHTYMERMSAGFYWEQQGGSGTRYPVGGYHDIVQRAKDDPSSRQLYLSIWHPEDQSNTEKRRLPCSLGYHFLVRNNTVNCTYFIRSCDAVRHFKNDIYLTARLVQDFTSRLGDKYEVGQLSMWIGSFHVFKAEKGLLRGLINEKTDNL